MREAAHRAGRHHRDHSEMGRARCADHAAARRGRDGPDRGHLRTAGARRRCRRLHDWLGAGEGLGSKVV